MGVLIYLVKNRPAYDYEVRLAAESTACLGAVFGGLKCARDCSMCFHGGRVVLELNAVPAKLVSRMLGLGVQKSMSI